MFTPARNLLVVLALTLAGTLHAQDEDAKAEPAPAAAVVVEDVPADPLDAQAQQYEQMLQPKMWRELEFIRKTCDLTREQRPKIKAAADASLKKAAKEVMRGMQRPDGQGDAGTFIRKEMRTTLEKTLTPEQMARYTEETAKRAAVRKKATLRSVVAQLDGYLYLSREQRDKVMQELQTNWKDDWESWIIIGQQYGGSYFPMIPDQHLVPHLNEKQKSVWQGVQKVNPGFWGGGGLRQQGNDDWWEGKEETEAKPAADAPKVEAKPE
jgi:hypothetical protein